MPKTEYGVKYSETINTWLISYQDNYQNLVWGAASAAISFDTLEDAQALAAAINGGTVGTTKPQS